MPRQRYLEWTGAGSRARRGALAPDGSLFLNVGGKPTDPWTALDVAQARASASAAAEHDPLDQVDRHREALAGRARRPRARTSRSATTSRSTASASCHDCHEFVFHFTPTATRRSPPGDRREVSGQVERRALARRRRRTCAAAATRGSSPTRRFRAARRNGRIRRRSRRDSLRCACVSTASIASATVADPFLGSDRPRSRARSSGSTSSASRWTRAT